MGMGGCLSLGNVDRARALQLWKCYNSDTNVKGHMKKTILPLFKAMGVVTRARKILFAAVDIEYLKEYEKILKTSLDARISFETDERMFYTLGIFSECVY